MTLALAMKFMRFSSIRLLLGCAGLCVAQPKIDYIQEVRNKPYGDLRTFGAKCDGVTNVQPAVTAALAAGYTHLFLGANCVWIPTGNALPNGISVMGEDLHTSKIWPTSPASTFLSIGAETIL